jgi:hypothetical protein
MAVATFLNPFWTSVPIRQMGFSAMVPDWNAIPDGAPFEIPEEFGPPSLPEIGRLLAAAVPRSVHRESGETAIYAPSSLVFRTGLRPSILHCEMDALAVTGWLLRNGYEEPKVLEIRSSAKTLEHHRSIWLEAGMNVYENGIHYVAVVGDLVFDLQSLLAPAMSLEHYLSQSFPDQRVNTVRHWPNTLRGELRLSRDFFFQVRSEGFRTFPELENDPLEKRPPLRSLLDILREGRERRLREP